MTTEQIRKSIHVSSYGLYEKGLKVEYKWYENKEDEGEERTLILLAQDAVLELTALGEIDNYVYYPLVIYWNNTGMEWDEFTNKYILSQWDALNLVIRHELAKEIEKEDGMLNLTKAIDNLKKL